MMNWSLKAGGFVTGEDFWRGIVAILAFLMFWEAGSRSLSWFGFALPWISQIPPPVAVMRELFTLFHDASFWQSALLSTLRVFEGFFAAMVIGIPRNSQSRS
jgi:NitT/TauT family transport system permease protein